MLINGVVADSISAGDRGLAYGDGVYRTLQTRHGRPLLWSWQWQRLAADCAALALDCPPAPLLLDEIASASAGMASAVVKITVTRGSGQRGYAIPAQCEGTRMVAASPWSGYPESRARDGVSVRLCDTRLALQPRLAGIKHLNRLENVLARSEWQDAALAEGLMLDMAGHLVEGTMSNLFLLRDGQWHTPLLDQCGVSGAMRACLIAHAPWPVQESRLTPDALLQADEAFLCNSLLGVWPLARLGSRQWQHWPQTRHWQSLLPRD